MRPLKASFLFFYCLIALGAIGFAVSHLWNTSKEMRKASVLLAASPVNSAATSSAQPS